MTFNFMLLYLICSCMCSTVNSIKCVTTQKAIWYMLSVQVVRHAMQVNVLVCSRIGAGWVGGGGNHITCFSTKTHKSNFGREMKIDIGFSVIFLQMTLL